MRGIFAAVAGMLFLAGCGKPGTSSPERVPPPRGGAPWKNSIGMEFVPVAGAKVLVSVYETRAREFDLFIAETGTEWVPPGVESSPEHAAVNVTWDDAVAFCAWLTRRERQARALVPPQRYRLPTEAEWALAADAAKHEFPWGDAWPPKSGAGNVSGEEAPVDRTEGDLHVAGYTDAFPRLSPVGQFQPNAFGLHDLGGNAMELCEDWYSPEHRGRVARGGSWMSGSREMLQTRHRTEIPPRAGLDMVGFRVVVEY